MTLWQRSALGYFFTSFSHSRGTAESQRTSRSGILTVELVAWHPADNEMDQMCRQDLALVSPSLMSRLFEG